MVRSGSVAREGESAMTVGKADKGKEDRQGKVGARIGSGEMKSMKQASEKLMNRRCVQVQASKSDEHQRAEWTIV